jgi:ribose transport system ATP-binding protein
MRLPAIIVTLASFIGLQGLSLALRPQAAGPITRQIKSVVTEQFIGIPVGMILVVLLVLALEWILYRSSIGRVFRAVGSSPTTSQRLGIKGDRVILLAFVLCGLLTGIAGLMLAGQVGIGSPVTGIDYTLISITAVVLGGASVSGGRGSIIATLMGATLVQTISSASSFINSDSSIRLTVLGIVTILAATFFSLARRNRSE